MAAAEKRFTVSGAATGKLIGTFGLEGVMDLVEPYAGELGPGIEFEQLETLEVGKSWRTHGDSRGLHVIRIAA